MLRKTGELPPINTPMLYIETPSLPVHTQGQSGGQYLGKADTAAGSPRGWGGLSCLRLSWVGNSKSSNLESQAAMTSVATQIRVEKKENPCSWALPQSVESVVHGNARSAVTLQSKWSLKDRKPLHSTSVPSLSRAATMSTHTLQQKQKHLLQQSPHTLYN